MYPSASTSADALSIAVLSISEVIEAAVLNTCRLAARGIRGYRSFAVGQNVDAAVRYRDGVLEMRCRHVVGGEDGPTIRIQIHIPFAHHHHRLNRERHSTPEREVAAE